MTNYIHLMKIPIKEQEKKNLKYIFYFLNIHYYVLYKRN